MVANANVINSLHFRRQMGRYLRKTENSLGWCDLSVSCLKVGMVLLVG